ncbi:Hypothetical protein (plasmid) [Pseudomonas putida]|nr:Hypothetical protein [Pseudomonas putida]
MSSTSVLALETIPSRSAGFTDEKRWPVLGLSSQDRLVEWPPRF